MSCRNVDLIFDLRRRIADLELQNRGLETAIRLHASGATAHIATLERRVAELESSQIDFSIMTDEELRAMLRGAGGRFHGPKSEHLSMPEADVFKFLRGLKVHSC